MSKKITDADFNEGITQREAYIHSLYYTLLAALPESGKEFAVKMVSQIRSDVDDMYPQPKQKVKAHG